MKKVIRNKLYNTESAKVLGSYETDSIKETLYKKKNGEFFIHGEGGAGTRYGRSTGNNNWSNGEMIIPLTPDTAREWAEKNLPDYKEIFEIQNETAQINAFISASARKKIEDIREKTREPIGRIISRVFEEY